VQVSPGNKLPQRHKEKIIYKKNLRVLRGSNLFGSGQNGAGRNAGILLVFYTGLWYQLIYPFSPPKEVQ
jgi:hypothetical protein